MNCECIKEVEEKMKEKYPEARCAAIGFSITATGIRQSITIPFKYRKNKKDGTPAKNESEISFLAGYCPFCGKTTKPSEEEK